MGQMVDLPLKFGAGHYLVSENGDAYSTREVGVIKAGSGRYPAGTIMTRESSGAQEYRPWATGDTNACILYEEIDARVNGAKRVFTVRNCEVQRSALSFAGTPNSSQKNEAYALLAVKDVVLR